MSIERRRYRFGTFELDVANAELRKDNVPVKLPPQPFNALHLLLTRAGTLVTRDELRARLWGDDSFVDFNAGLNFCIGQLRSALDDPAAESRLIVTVPRRGYRFIADVTVVEDAPAPEAQTKPGGMSRVNVALAAGVMILVAGLAAAWFLHVPRRPPVLARSLEALKNYERATSALGDAGPAELLDRVGFFETALRADPAWPEAWAGLAEAKLIAGNYRAEAPQNAYAAAKAAALKALALDSGLGAAHAAYGAAALYFEWDWKTAGAHLRRGVALSPSSPRAHYWYSRYLSARGDHSRALQHARTAVSLSPASPSLRTQLGMTEFYSGRFAEARAACNEGVALMPEFLPAHWCASASESEVAAAPGFWTERLERLQSVRSEGELLDRALSIAVTLVHAGDRAGALDVLERAANRRTDVLLFAGVHPALRSLDGEPRYRRILERVGVQ